MRLENSTGNLTSATEMSLAVTFESKQSDWSKYIPLHPTNEKNMM